MMRREFIAGLGGVAVWPLAARAQQGKPVIGYLSAGSEVAEAPALIAFRQGLNQGTYVEGRNVEILFRYADNQLDHLRSLAFDLVGRRVAVIIAISGAAAAAAKAATSTTPIVFTTATDPVVAGFVASLNRPGGNMTGTSRLIEAFFAKGVELLHELLPQAGSVARVAMPTSYYASSQPLQESFSEAVKEAENTARAFGLRLNVLEASNPLEIEQAFARVRQERSGGLLVDPNGNFYNQRDQFVTLAARYRVPTIYSWREAVEAGGLMSYGASINETLRVVGNYTARILKGDKPADLPIQQATKFELVINLKTAKALGLAVPQSILVRADEVIE
jgi:putative tryptophan/tyrosine transport system substrate-binding protein